MKKGSKQKSKRKPVIIQESVHGIVRKKVSKSALRVIKGLQEAGYEAYIVGGGVRDLMLGRWPKDFDIATDASPEEVSRVFRNCRLIGRRFRLAHVYFGPEIIEVATFRGEATVHEHRHYGKHGALVRDNVYGSIEDDAWRRDFTINALFYDPAAGTVFDYVDGLRDLADRKIKMIGKPDIRLREDPVRMLRALRIGGKLDLSIDPEIRASIDQYKSLLTTVPPARLFEEVVKIYRSGRTADIFSLLRDYGLFQIMFPSIAACLMGEEKKMCEAFLFEVFRNADERITHGKTLSPAFLFAALLWWPLQRSIKQFEETGLTSHEAFIAASEKVLRDQNRQIAVSKRLGSLIRETWFTQFQLFSPRRRQAYRLLLHPRFRAAYDFFKLRAEVENDLKPMAEWWTKFKNAKPIESEKLIQKLYEERSREKIKKR